MDKKEFLKCCVGLVTVKNIPFRIFDDHDFFKKIIGPYEQKFGVNLNSKNIGLVVEKASQEIKDIITRRVEKKNDFIESGHRNSYGEEHSGDKYSIHKGL